jgi:hypothetical protein
MPHLAAPHLALRAPIDRHTHVALRSAVLELVEGEHRRRFPAALHAGVPGRSVVHLEDPPLADAGARADLVLALVVRARAMVPRPVVWLTRSGELSTHDDDLRWLGPVAWACSSIGEPVGLVVVTRRGWFDPVSGVRREWRRLRPRHQPAS